MYISQVSGGCTWQCSERLLAAGWSFHLDNHPKVHHETDTLSSLSQSSAAFTKTQAERYCRVTSEPTQYADKGLTEHFLQSDVIILKCLWNIHRSIALEQKITCKTFFFCFFFSQSYVSELLWIAAVLWSNHWQLGLNQFQPHLRKCSHAL